VVESTRLTNPALAGGASADRSFEFSGASQEGQYVVRIYMNAEGSDPGVGVPGPQGLRGFVSGGFVAGLAEQQADNQNRDAWMSALSALASSGPLWPPQRAIEHLTEGVNWLAAIDDLTDEDREAVQLLAYWLTAGATAYGDNLEEPANVQFREWLQQVSGTASSLQMNQGDQAGRSELLRTLKKLSG
jgi:hypothetical protein